MIDTRLRNTSRFQWALVLALPIGLYLFIHLALSDMFTGFGRTYVVQPILWCLVILGVLLLSRFGSGGKLRFGKTLLWIGLLMGAFQVACLVIGGLLTGFGNSPYVHTPYVSFLTVVYFGTALVGIEFIRAYLLSAFGKRYTVVMIALLSLLFTALSIPLTRWAHLGDSAVLPFFGGTCLPLFAENMLTCFLAITGGPLAAIAYRGLMEAFEWFSPILPDLTWIVKAFIGTLAPVVGLVVIQTMCNETESAPRELKPQTKKRFSWFGWVVTAVVAVVMLWFCSGLLGFSPVVVVSGSMSPAIAVGDVTIVKEVSTDDINEGDVIQYAHDNITTIHRVIEVQEVEGSRSFITQGDANQDADSKPVYPEQILGKVQFCIPKVGWVSIGIKNLFSKLL